MACVSKRNFSNTVGVTVLKLNLTLEELDSILGRYLNKEINKGM